MAVITRELGVGYPLGGDIDVDVPDIRAHITNTTWSARDENGNRTCSAMYTPDPSPPPPSSRVETVNDRVIAEHILDRVGGLAVALFRRDSTDAVHIIGAFDPDWIAHVPVPEPDPTDAELGGVFFLVGETGATRFSSGKDLWSAYKEQPRTRVHNSIDMLGGWPSIVAQRLGQHMLETEIVASTIRSGSYDGTFGLHTDTSPGMAIQFEGEKDWMVGGVELTMRPGDVLALPAGVPHDVSTPEDPGTSLHMLISAVERSN